MLLRLFKRSDVEATTVDELPDPPAQQVADVVYLTSAGVRLRIAPNENGPGVVIEKLADEDDEDETLKNVEVGRYVGSGTILIPPQP